MGLENCQSQISLIYWKGLYPGQKEQKECDDFIF